MKKSLKKATAILLALLMVTTTISALPFTASAAEAEKSVGAISGETGDCTWTLDDDGTLTISGNGAMEDYLNAPWKNYEFTEAVIEDGVTNIGNNAFSRCTSLTNINIPKSVTTIGSGAFNHCTSLTSIDIPDGVALIDAQTFDGCSSLTNVIIPDNVTKIRYEAFSDCPNLTSIIIPESVTNIEYRAIYDCPKVKIYGKEGSAAQSYAGPNSIQFVSLLDYGETGGCKWTLGKDGTLTIRGNGKMYNGYDGYYNVAPWTKNVISVVIESGVTNISRCAFSSCPQLVSVSIPDTVTEIDADAFMHSYNLKSITIPGSVNSIGEGAFYDCLGIESVVLGNGVEHIGDSAFLDCENLKSITLPKSVRSIGEGVFECCSELESVEFGNSVESIGAGAFASCKKLKSIIIPSSVTFIGEDTFAYCSEDFVIKGKSGIEAQNYAEDNNIPFVTLLDYGTTSDYCSWSCCTWTLDDKYTLAISGNGDMGFYLDYSYTPWFGWHDDILKVVINRGVTNIGYGAFQLCRKLKYVEIPDSVESIDGYAFDCCYSLTDIVMPNSVTSIWKSAFEDCHSLTSIHISDSATRIDNNAFWHCFDLTSIDIPDSVTDIGSEAFKYTEWYESQPDGIVYAGKVAYSYKGTMPENTSLTLEEGTVGIAARAFYGCSGLTSIEIPNSVTSIGNFAFYGCVNLETISIPDSLANIGYKAFENTKWYDNKQNGIVYAGNVFCSYKGEMSTVTSLKLEKGTVGIAAGAASNCENLTEIEIPEGVKIIGAGAFFGCKKLEKGKIIPHSITSIGSYAFAFCEKLKSITIPSSVTNIGNYAFINCSSLKSITIPPSVNSIGIKAFGYSTEKSFDNYEKFEDEVEKSDSDIVFTKIEDFSITGKNDSKADIYAKENGFVNSFIPIEYKFSWGSDNWNFNNDEKSFSGAKILEEQEKKEQEKIISTLEF